MCRPGRFETLVCVLELGVSVFSFYGCVVCHLFYMHAGIRSDVDFLTYDGDHPYSTSFHVLIINNVRVRIPPGLHYAG